MARPFRPLDPAEPIGVIALSGPVNPKRLRAGIEVLESWGNPVLVAPNVTASAGYLAGTDEQRVGGLHWVLARGARVLIAARGGFGVTRTMFDLALDELADTGTTFVGYSDLTALLNGMVAAGAAAQIHGPMVAAGLARRRNAERLLRLLRGSAGAGRLFRFSDRRVVRHGLARGRIIGGNLALIEASLGTPYEPDFDDAVLFLEEVGEPTYRLDRMLTHLRASGRLRGVKALICGSLRGCGPVRDRDSRWRELVAETMSEMAPIVVDLPFGHGAVNLAFPIGAEVVVDTGAGEIRWSS